MMFHNLRHGYAKPDVGSQQDIKVVSELLGHSSTYVTHQVYQDVIPRLRQEAVDKLHELVGGEA